MRLFTWSRVSRAYNLFCACLCGAGSLAALGYALVHWGRPVTLGVWAIIAYGLHLASREFARRLRAVRGSPTPAAAEQLT